MTKLICKKIFYWLTFDHVIMNVFKDGCRWQKYLAGKFILAYKIEKNCIILVNIGVIDEGTYREVTVLSVPQHMRV